MRYSTTVVIGIALASGLACAAEAQPPPVIPLPREPAPSAVPPVQPLPGACAPVGLFRAVVRNISPGLAAADRRAQPRTIYRLGATNLRSEEQPDPARGDQAVVVIAEPDIWVLNLSTRTGRHGVDPGPDLSVHAPILAPTPDMPGPFRTLEYGCEGEFVTRFAPAEQRLVKWGTIVAAIHTVTVGDHSLALLMDKQRNYPLLVSYLRQGKPVLVLRYDAYRTGLPEQPNLFVAPKGFNIVESPKPPVELPAGDATPSD